MKSPHEFYLQYNGKGTDPDGAYGFQCVDLFNQFCIDAGYPYPLVEGAKDFFEAWKKNLGHLQENFQSIAFENKQDGDWFVFGAPHGYAGNGKYYGHIGMNRKDNGNGTCVLFGQNQGAPNGVANQINIGYEGLLIILRPNCYANTTPKQTASQDECDQILTKNSKVKFGYEYTVDSVDVPNNKVHLVELGVWIDANHLVETKEGD